MTTFAYKSTPAALSFSASREGREIDLHRRRATGRLRYSNVVGHAWLRSDLHNLANECADAGWDGYDAMPVDAGAIERALEVLDAVSAARNGVVMSVGAEADGQVTIEWHRSASWTLSVSVSGSGELHYSALLGSGKAYGTELFDASVGIPDTLRQLIGRVEAA